MSFYHAETIQLQTRYQSTVDLIAAILKVVMREGTKKGIEIGAHLSFTKEKHFPLILIAWQTSLK
jgi:hypothetical protein